MPKAKDKAQEDSTNQMKNQDQSVLPDAIDERETHGDEGLPEEGKAKTPREEKKVISQEGPWRVQRAPVSGADCV